MRGLPIECKNCGQECGSYDPGRTWGDPEKCYPPEYINEPEFIDDDGNEFCSQACYDEWHAEPEDPEAYIEDEREDEDFIA